MALNAATLAAAIKANLLAAPETCATDNAALTAMCNAIATAVVTHITGSATLVGTATGAMSGGPGVPVVGTVT